MMVCIIDVRKGRDLTERWQGVFQSLCCRRPNWWLLINEEKKNVSKAATFWVISVYKYFFGLYNN